MKQISKLRRATAPLATAAFVGATGCSQNSPQASPTRLPHTLFQMSQTAEKTTGPEPRIQTLAAWPQKTLALDPITDDPAGKAANQKVTTFVADNAKVLGVENNAAKLVLTDVRSTLTGRRISLEQRLNDIPIVDTSVQLTVNKEGEVQSVVRNVVNVPEAALSTVSNKTSLEPKAAQQLVWNDLKVTGKLLETPSVDKAYVLETNALTLVYVVKLAVTEPFGYWEYHVDATSGRIVSKRDRAIKEGKRADTGNADKSNNKTTAAAPLANMEASLADFNAAQKAPEPPPEAKAAVAKGLVFLPNPISTLKNTALRDSDPGTKFDTAYVKIDLKDLQKSDGKLHLKGPLVRIEDFEPGDGKMQRAPSTETTEWTAKRGANAFNDVMTYHHIHQSLTYLRTLGYQGTNDLFPKGIAADSDGLNGDDQSHYVGGSSDKLAFGHGCVDDNEDADVIMHELGHAISQHINSNWSGGDSKAIGEGFGDYWAISSRMRMTDGMAIDGLKVFIWDGVGTCWSGRRADRLNSKYDPAKTYGAHENMGGFESDELWSTPLVSALQELTKAGESHESVDQVVLQGMASVGSGFTMRTLALVTVQQANLLFPKKPHAAVFEKHFKHHGIIK